MFVELRYGSAGFKQSRPHVALHRSQQNRFVLRLLKAFEKIVAGLLRAAGADRWVKEADQQHTH